MDVHVNGIKKIDLEANVARIWMNCLLGVRKRNMTKFIFRFLARTGYMVLPLPEIENTWEDPYLRIKIINSALDLWRRQFIK